MKRREFIRLLGGAAAAWPLAARAQQAERMRRIGVLYILGPDDQEAHLRSTVFERSLQQLGWTVGRNLQIDYRLAAGDPDRLRQYAVAQSLGVDLTALGVRDSDEIERGVTAFARSPDVGLIVTAGGLAFRRDVIIGLASRYKLPAVYPFRYYAVDGGLISYGPDTHDPIRRAAGYVDRILKGEKPADLPVQAPTKYELVINLKTAKALGLTVPPTLLARADEVIA
jgi:ABC transporter substrate binding protein